MPTHEFVVASTPAVVEYILDDAIDYRRNGYEVIIVGSADLPQRGVWIELVDADLRRRAAAPFPEVDVLGVPALARSAFSL